MNIRSVIFWQALATASLLGCSTATPGGTPDAATSLPVDAGDAVDAGAPDAGAPDAGPSCPAGSHLGDDAGCDSAVTWAEGPVPVTALNHHVTFIDDSTAQAQLYVMGGISGPQGSVMLDAIERAPLDATGNMQPWQSAGTLPRPLAGFTLSRVGQTLMVVSGITQVNGNLGRSRFCSVAQIQADGSIGSWSDGPQLPDARFHAGTATVGNFTYVIGGIGESSVPTDTVYRSTFDGTTFGAWEILPALPGLRSHQAVIAHEGRIYLIAGIKADTLVASDYYLDVISAAVNADGSLGEWQTASTTPLPTPVSTEATFEKDGAVYILGGIGLVSGSLKLTNAVRRAPFATDGTVGSWETLTPMPKARGHVHQTPLFANTWVYSVGGTSDLSHDSIPDVFIGTFQ